MAEIRKYQQDAGEGIGRLVREALGETVRPDTPGVPRTEQPVSVEQVEDDDSLTTIPLIGFPGVNL